MLAPDAWVALAEVARPHGVRGELRLRPFNRDSDLLLELEAVFVHPVHAAEQPGRQLRVENARRTNDAILMKLAGVDDRDAADGLRGWQVCARRREFPPLDPGEFYACDIEGARVVLESADPAASSELGRVITLRQYPSVDVLAVAAADGGRPWEVPLVSGVVRRVDVAGGVVVLSTLEGVERE